jgi:hypothetical protein
MSLWRLLAVSGSEAGLSTLRNGGIYRASSPHPCRSRSNGLAGGYWRVKRRITDRELVRLEADDLGLTLSERDVDVVLEKWRMSPTCTVRDLLLGIRMLIDATKKPNEQTIIHY